MVSPINLETKEKGLGVLKGAFETEADVDLSMSGGKCIWPRFGGCVLSRSSLLRIPGLCVSALPHPGLKFFSICLIISADNFSLLLKCTCLCSHRREYNQQKSDLFTVQKMCQNIVYPCTDLEPGDSKLQLDETNNNKNNNTSAELGLSSRFNDCFPRT